MKSKFIIIFPLYMLACFYGNALIHAGIIPQQNKKEMKLDRFTGINLQISAELFLTQGDLQQVVIEADEDILEKIEAKVEENTLKISCKNWSFQGNKKVIINITVPSVEKLILSGSGEIFSKTPIEADQLALTISGSGNIQINELSAKNIESKISGSGNIILSGATVAESHKIKISGSGNCKAEGLESANVEASVSGSGNCKVFASKKLEASISGSGNIYYKGSPLIDVSVSGSGNVKKLN